MVRRPVSSIAQAVTRGLKSEASDEESSGGWATTDSEHEDADLPALVATDSGGREENLTKRLWVSGPERELMPVISLTIVAQDGKRVSFEVNRTDPLSTLMSNFCARSGMGQSSVRFCFDGSRINPSQSPFDVRLFPAGAPHPRPTRTPPLTPHPSPWM